MSSWFNGTRIAKRSDHATWISLEPGWRVFDTKQRDLVIERDGVRVQSALSRCSQKVMPDRFGKIAVLCP